MKNLSKKNKHNLVSLEKKAGISLNNNNNVITTWFYFTLYVHTYIYVSTFTFIHSYFNTPCIVYIQYTYPFHIPLMYLSSSANFTPYTFTYKLIEYMLQALIHLQHHVLVRGFKINFVEEFFSKIFKIPSTFFSLTPY